MPSAVEQLLQRAAEAETKLASTVTLESFAEASSAMTSRCDAIAKRCQEQFATRELVNR